METATTSILIVAPPGEAPLSVGADAGLRVLTSEPAATLATVEREGIAVVLLDLRAGASWAEPLLRELLATRPSLVRLAVSTRDGIDAALFLFEEGLVARTLIEPFGRAALEELLGWAVAAHSLATADSAVLRRLELAERLISLGGVAAAVMHDLNGPVSSGAANAERLRQLAAAAPELENLLLRHASELQPATARLLADLAVELPDIARDVLEGSRAMHALTRSVRPLGRAPSALDPRGCDPVAAMRWALAACRQRATLNRANLRYEGPETLPRAAIGAPELTQIVLALAANAVQAVGRKTPPGGHVRVGARVDGDRLELSVTDNGPGMTPEVLARAGTPLFSTKPDGAGLGLATARRLIARAHGELALDSSLESGTCATVRLLLAKG